MKIKIILNIKFIGVSSPPFNGFENFKIRISRVEDLNKLPTAHVKINIITN